jgi:hypothetical protein
MYVVFLYDDTTVRVLGVYKTRREAKDALIRNETMVKDYDFSIEKYLIGMDYVSSF